MENDAPLLMVIGALSTSAEFKVIVPVFVMRIPPVAEKLAIHSGPAVKAPALLYCKVAFEP